MSTIIENQLLEAFPQFRRIWVQHCVVSKTRKEYRIVITAFPADGSVYRMFFTPKVVNCIDLRECKRIIENDLEN